MGNQNFGEQKTHQLSFAIQKIKGISQRWNPSSVLYNDLPKGHQKWTARGRGIGIQLSGWELTPKWTAPEPCFMSEKNAEFAEFCGLEGVEAT